MALMKWNERLSVGVAEIDEQHKGLIDLINTLHEAMLKGQPDEVLGEITDGLIEYTRTHFATEEKYFDLYGYPKAGPHKEEHKDFLAKVDDFKQGFDEGRVCLSIDVMNFLQDWVSNHMDKEDGEFGPFFQKMGLT